MKAGEKPDQIMGARTNTKHSMWLDVGLNAIAWKPNKGYRLPTVKLVDKHHRCGGRDLKLPCDNAI
eukprot:10630337-Prorocentrum_lima.AAC.1